ncbi:MAG TPA: GntR family transcriptional regulator, partial [Marinobacter hydrocarbonoclasticus]|nr:GntR family transcriptional regulator [Marinobacter nauticus]
YDIYIDLLCMLARKVLERWPGEQLGGMMGQVNEMQAVIDALNSNAPDAAERVIEAGFGVM